MVEPWSSKPLAWVRFLLLLITLVKHTPTNSGKKRHKNYRGRKSSSFIGSKTSFFIINLNSSARRNAKAGLTPTNVTLRTKMKRYNYSLSSGRKLTRFNSQPHLTTRKSTSPHYLFKPTNFKNFLATSGDASLSFVVLSKVAFYGLSCLPLLPNFTEKVLGKVVIHTNPLAKWQSFVMTKSLGTVFGLNLLTTDFTSIRAKPSRTHHRFAREGQIQTLKQYLYRTRVFCRYSTLTFLKLLISTNSTQQAKRGKPLSYFGRRKGLLRGLQNALVATTFLRFYNYRVRIQSVASASQVVTKHQLTRNDNWFLYNPSVTQGSSFRGTNFQFTYLDSQVQSSHQAPATFKNFSTPNPSLPYKISTHSGPIQLSTRLFQHTLSSVLLYKYFTTLFSWSGNPKQSTGINSEGSLLNFLKIYFFESRTQLITQTNLLPSDTLSYRIRTKFISLFLKNPFRVNVTMWYHTMLIRFIENCSGLKVGLAFNPFLENSLTYADVARCSSWADRVFDFRRLLGPKIFIKESLKIFHLAFRLKDPTFLSAWIREMLKRTSFWKYRVLFRYVKYLVRHLFFTVFADLQFKGFKLKLKGKISVGGNSRARTLMYRVGETSQSTFKNKVTHDLNFVYTFTGIMGFQLWFYF